MNERGDGGAAGELRRPKAPRAKDDPVHSVGTGRTYADRLENAAFPDRGRELFQALGVEGAPWLIRVFLDRGKWDFERLAARSRGFQRQEQRSKGKCSLPASERERIGNTPRSRQW